MSQDPGFEDLLRAGDPGATRALSQVMGDMWKAGGGDDLRWYGVYDPEMKWCEAFFTDRTAAEERVAMFNRADPTGTPMELKTLTLSEAVAAMVETQRLRVRLSMSYGQHLKPGDLP